MAISKPSGVRMCQVICYMCGISVGAEEPEKYAIDVVSIDRLDGVCREHKQWYEDHRPRIGQTWTIRGGVILMGCPNCRFGLTFYPGQAGVVCGGCGATVKRPVSGQSTG